MNMSHAKTPRAILWDFGGVILSSPFEEFNRYEAEIGLPKDFIRSLNARNGDTNAWAKMERSEFPSRVSSRCSKRKRASRVTSSTAGASCSR